LRYVYVGNLMDAERSNTICPHCGETLIERMWYQVNPLWQEAGVCHACGTEIAGIWR
jgi:pyruvate formate lyase activating enzyme